MKKEYIRFILSLICVTIFSTLSIIAQEPLPDEDDIVSTFEDNQDGWSIHGDGSAITYHDLGGNPGGHICSTDLRQGSTWYFQAPTKFLGDLSDAYGQTLSFELKQSSVNSQFDNDDIILIGADYILLFDTNYNPQENWTQYQITLSEESGWIDEGSQNSVSEEIFREVLSNLITLQIRGEYVDGSDTGCIDNVFLRVSSPVECPNLGPSGVEGIRLENELPITGSITDAQNLITYRFVALAGDVVTIAMNRTSGDLLPFLGLADPQGNILFRSAEGFDPGLASISNYTIEEDNCYYIFASRKDISSGETRGDYVITVAGISGGRPEVPSDAIAGDDIVINDVVAGSLSSDAPRTVHVFRSSVQGIFTVIAERMSGDFAPTVILLDANQQELNRVTANFEGDASNPLTFDASVDDYFFIIVEPEQGTGVGDYILSVTG